MAKTPRSQQYPRRVEDSPLPGVDEMGLSSAEMRLIEEWKELYPEEAAELGQEAMERRIRQRTNQMLDLEDEYQAAGMDPLEARHQAYLDTLPFGPRR